MAASIFQMRSIFCLCSLVFATVASAFQFFDGFDDGVINSDLWVPSQENGSVSELNGTLQLSLNGGSYGSSNALVELQREISSGYDFSISADITYQFPANEGPIFGIVIFRELESGFRQGTFLTTNWTNSMAVSTDGPDLDYEFINGGLIGNNSFTFEIHYFASGQSFEFSVLVDELAVNTISHSINAGSGTDLSTDWNLSPESKFGVLIVSESWAEPVINGMVMIDSFELIAVPEPRFFSLVFGIFALFGVGILRIGRFR